MTSETFDLAADREDILQIRLDLRSIGFDYRRYFWLFLPVFICVFSGVYLYHATRPATYTATARLTLDPRDVKITTENYALIPSQKDDTPESMQLNTELVLLQQPSLAERVVDALKLDQANAFNASKSPAEATATVSERQAKIRRKYIASAILSGLKITREGSTRVVNINFTAVSPDLAAAIANEWGRQYIAQKIDNTQADLETAGAGMATRLEALRQDVMATDQAVANYKITHNLMTVGDTSLTEGEVSALNQQVTDTKLTLAEKEAQAATAKQQLGDRTRAAATATSATSSVLDNLRVRRARITRNIADLQTAYGPLHPKIISARQQLVDIDQQIGTESDRIISGLQAEVDIERRRLGSTTSNLNETVATLAGTYGASVGLSELERDAEGAQKIYESYLSLYQQSLTANPHQGVQARLISEAKPPAGPSAPDLPLGFLYALLTGAGAGAAVVLARRGFETGIVVPGDIGYKLGQPHLATLVNVLPSDIDKTAKVSLPDYILQKPGSAFAEGLRALRASLVYMAGDRGGILAITSPLPSEGKSTTSVCLAKIIAMSGQSVIVVECDLRRPGLSAALNRKARAGLLEVLSGEEKLEAVLLKDESGVDYLLAPRKGQEVTGVFETPVMDRLLTYLRSRYDIVILDTPPVLAISETQILSAKADQTVMLVRWAKTPVRAVKASLELLSLHGGQVTGIALTQMNERLFSKITVDPL